MKRSLAVVVVLALGVTAFIYLRSDRRIPVSVVEVGPGGDASGGVERRWYAKDRGRYDTEDGMVHIVRLDKAEIWVLDKKRRECLVCPIASLEQEMARVDERLLAAARQDPAWNTRFDRLSALLKEGPGVETSQDPRVESRYDCLSLTANVEGILQIRSLIAQDGDIPSTAIDIDLAMAVLGGASKGYGSVLYEWRKASRVHGNLPVRTRTVVSLPGMASPAVSESRLVRVYHDRVGPEVFEVPDGYAIRHWTP